MVAQACAEGGKKNADVPIQVRKGAGETRGTRREQQLRGGEFLFFFQDDAQCLPDASPHAVAVHGTLGEGKRGERSQIQSLRCTFFKLPPYGKGNTGQPADIHGFPAPERPMRKDMLANFAPMEAVKFHPRSVAKNR